MALPSQIQQRSNLPLPVAPHTFTAQKFLSMTNSLERNKREYAAVQLIINGHVPSFLQQLKKVTIHEQKHTLTFWTFADYISIGNDLDYMIYPLNLHNALSLAEHLRMILPTTKLVDTIYAQADYRLSPQPLPASLKMSTNMYISQHQELLLKNFPAKRRYGLIAGHKKDVVISKLLLKYPHRLAIYGWHRKNYTPIQPLSLYHEADYSDYSHGIRLVSRKALLDGKPIDLKNLLKDPSLSYLISYEGAIDLDLLMKNTN